MPDKLTAREWHLDRTVSVSHLLATLTIAGTLLGYAVSQEGRVSRLETNQNNLVREVARQDFERQELGRAIRDDLKGVNAKLDRLIEGRRR
jgi:hypothetical protein